MKKPTKSIIASSLLALAFGAMSVGSTFALFTSQSQTEINIGSGIVNVESRATLVNYSSTVDGTDHDFEGTETSYSNDKVGNLFKIEGSIVTIDKMVPGDSLTIKLTALNKSNVKTKTRYMVSHSKVGEKSDLFKALRFSFNTGTLSPIDLFKWKDTNPALNPTDGDALYGEDGFLVTISLPDNDNGEILFNSGNKDNEYQDSACSLVFSLQAVQGNAAISPIEEINAYLVAEMMLEGQNSTMHDAVADMGEIEYTDLSVLDGYVYDLANDQFVKETGVTTNKLNYFKAYSSMPSTQDFSIYALGENWTGANVEDLVVGFDAGDTTGITSIEYDRHDALVGQEVTIRTNTAQTTLTIDAPLDTIHHYDALGALNIIEAATASYHEFGSIAFAEIAKGRIVLEKGSDVNQIHINKKADEQAFDTIIIANNGGAAELPEKITRDAVTVLEETLVVKVESNGSSENVYVYAEGQKGTTEKTSIQNEDVESALGQLVLDNGSEPGEKAQTPAEKEAEKEALVEEAIYEETYQPDVFILANGAAEETGVYKTLAEFRDSVNLGATYAGYTITLQRNVDLESINWVPIGNSTSTPFMGTFDGANYTIDRLYIYNQNDYQGLFGYVADATIKNLSITNALISALSDSGIIVGGVKDLNNARTVTFVNCHVNSGHIEVSEDTVGGICGRVHDYSGAATFTNCSNSASVTANGDHYRAGGILGACGSTSLLMTSCSNTGTINSIYAGGILGATRGLAQGGTFTFSNCSNTGTLNGTSTGKFIGFINSSSSGNDYLTISIDNESEITNLFGVWFSGGTEGGILTVELGEDLYKYLLIPTYTYSITEGKIVSLSKVNNVAHSLASETVTEATSEEWTELLALNPKAAIYNEDSSFRGVSPTTNCYAPNSYYIQGPQFEGMINTWVKLAASN